jgi:cilia- and flagella-associated protein 251
VGNFTQSTFLPSPDTSTLTSTPYFTTAASATMDGEVVVWDIPPFDSNHVSDWGVKAVKSLQLHQGPIRVLTASSNHIVTGGEEGFVRFYDLQFRILAWFEDLGAGPVAMLSFSRVPPDPYDSSEFKDAEFITATREGVVVCIQPSSWEDTNPEKQKGKVIMQFHDGSVFGIATHPSKSLFATTGHSGLLQLWDYDIQSLVASRRFDKLMGHRVVFDPKGKYIGTPLPPIHLTFFFLCVWFFLF